MKPTSWIRAGAFIAVVNKVIELVKALPLGRLKGKAIVTLGDAIHINEIRFGIENIKASRIRSKQSKYNAFASKSSVNTSIAQYLKPILPAESDLREIFWLFHFNKGHTS